jgi:hypothetical protein
MSVTLEELRKNNSVEVHASGKLHKTDYDRFVPLMEKIIREQGKARVLFVMDDFHGWDGEAFWEDVKFDVRHFNDLKRIAFVGDKKWEKWMAKFCGPFTSAKVRYFPLEKQEEARRWLIEK